MIYLKHNLKGNWANATGLQDEEMKEGIIMSEVGKLIAVKPEVIITYLRASGVKVSDGASLGRLVDLVSDTIPRSRKFTALLAEEIEGKGRASGVMGADGGSTGSGNGWSDVDWGQMASSTASIADSLGQLFGKGKAKPKAKPVLKKKTNAIKGIADGGMSSGAKWAVGISVGVALVVGIGFAVYKYKH